MSRRRHRRHFRRQTPPGTAPGTLAVDPAARPGSVHVMAYGPAGLEEAHQVPTAELEAYVARWPVTWVNVDGLGNAEQLEHLRRQFGLHPLAMEDVVHVHQRAKVEQYGDFLFIVARRVALNHSLESEQISFFLGRQVVLTFQEGLPGDCFEPVRERLRTGRGNLRQAGPDLLAHALLDAVIDSYFPVLETLGTRLDALDVAIDGQTISNPTAALHDIRGDLLQLHRYVWPHRDAIASLTRDPHTLVGEESRLYLRDCYDHTVQLVDLLQSYRELCSDLRDFHLTTVGYRTNEIMKVLTIISTIFIPLSFVAGVYGMNFDTSHTWNMPELRSPLGYLFSLLLMLAVALGMLAFFYRRGWIGGTRATPWEPSPPAEAALHVAGIQNPKR